MDVTAYAASIGHSIWFSYDLGESGNRAATPTGGSYNESRCWSLSVHQARQGEVLAGTDIGVYRWNYLHEHWSYISSPMDDLHIQQIAQAPHNPDIIFAGTRPAEIFRSGNGAARSLIVESSPIYFSTSGSHTKNPALIFPPSPRGLS